jgi:hypothetical protein
MDEGSRVEDIQSLTELWLERPVVIQHLAGTPDGEQPVAKKEEMVLTAYSALGVEAQRSAEEPSFFMPWSAILSIRGPSQEEIEREQRDRQALMDQLSGARTSSEMADARAAADDWLSAHPGDGDVRLAREQLEAHKGDE